MIDTVLNLLVRCSHRHLTRPITPVTKSGEPHGGTYVVCLDCGKQFAYDVAQMHIGKPIERSRDTGVLPPNPPKSHKKSLALTILAAIPAAFMLGAVLKRGKENPTPADRTESNPVHPDQEHSSQSL